MKHKANFKWNDLHDESFNKFKDIIMNSDHLGFYGKDLPTFINTDASNYGIGGYIYQIDPKGEKRFISFDSRTLSESESEKNHMQ